MRKHSMLQILMVIFFVLGYVIASAQDYVVTIKGDTLHGKVKYFNGSGVKYTGTPSKYIQLTPTTGKKATFQVLQTVSFKMNDEVYHTIKFLEGYTFMKVISPGYLTLYGYQLENQTSWDGRYFVKKDGSLLEIPNLGFKKKVMQFLADCPDVVKKIEDGDLGKTSLVKITEEYNACVELKSTLQPVKKSPAREAWSNLEKAVKQLPEFDKKSDAVEMLNEIQNKLIRNETVPSFLISGIKEALKDQASVKDALNEAVGKQNN